MPAFLRLAMLVMIAAASAYGSAEAVVQLAEHRPREPRVATVGAPSRDLARPSPTDGGARAVMKARDGHFWAEAEVNGVPVRFLVDTGATVVALTPADAERLGFDLSRLHYVSSVVTAGGRTRAAAVELDWVEVGGARVDDVEALVIEKGLDASLLGMSYLGRLSSFQATREAMVLRP